MSDNRRAVAEEEGESNGGCSGSAVGMDRASSHVLSSSGEGGGGAQGEGEEVDRLPWTHQGGLGP